MANQQNGQLANTPQLLYVTVILFGCGVQIVRPVGLRSAVETESRRILLGCRETGQERALRH